MSSVSGYIRDTNGTPVARTLRLYRRDTGAFINSSVSNSVTGYYSIDSSGYVGECYVVLLDDVIGAIENDQILRVIPA